VVVVLKWAISGCCTMVSIGLALYLGRILAVTGSGTHGAGAFAGYRLNRNMRVGRIVAREQAS
jgi:hypothetical protein